ncbi:MAG: hemerythrin domain-containing protein [Burkholderiaceae bacterium]|nr:hemerythrin domain-containing protein [Burkholderiaceae bacterium]
MSQALPGLHSPAVGFEVPLEMLAACHGRVQHQCATLRRLASHLRTHGPDQPAQEAARAIMRYFDSAAHHHHEDEEQDLFPALLEAVAGSDAVCLRQLTASLQADRRELEQHWADLRPRLLRVSDALVDHLDTEVVEAFVGRYEDHIRREEADLLPMAARLLSDAELDRIGQAMRARRQTIDGT